jgi:hypothetical protein
MQTRSLVVACLATVILGGCGSSTPVARTKAVDTTSSTSSSSDGSASGITAPLHYVGTMNISGEDAAISVSYSIGPIFHGTTGRPPIEALKSCNWDDRLLITKSFFARGVLALSYTHGPAPILVEVEPVLLVFGEDAGKAVLNVNGHWECGQYGHPRETLHPRESKRYEMWVLTEPLGPDVITPSTSSSWQFEPNAFTSSAFRRNSTVTTSGPGARTCAGKAALFLYPTTQSCQVG